MLTRSTLPVRSPLPNRQPSMRSAPAIRANSPAAVPVPRSLCGCTDSTIASRRARWRCIHSIMSAKMLGVRMLHRRRQVDDALALRASAARPRSRHRPRAWRTASSVPENISGEYWKVQSVCGCFAARSRIRRACVVGELDDAVLVQAEHDLAHHRRGGVVQVHDHPLGAAQRLEGAADQRLARLRQHLDRHVVGHQVLARSAGARSRIRSATPTGKPTSISLKPIAHQRLEHAQLARRCPSARSAPGCRRAGRRCTRAARAVSTASGQVRSVRRDRGEGAVLGWRDCFNMAVSQVNWSQPAAPKQNGPLLVHTGRWIGKRVDVTDRAPVGLLAVAPARS